MDGLTIIVCIILHYLADLKEMKYRTERTVPEDKEVPVEKVVEAELEGLKVVMNKSKVLSTVTPTD